jgi:hypothetical protein
MTARQGVTDVRDGPEALTDQLASRPSIHKRLGTRSVNGVAPPPLLGSAECPPWQTSR